MEIKRIQNEITLGNLRPFQLDITYTDTDSTSSNNVSYPHTHSECEIYINLSGDVSFMVENHVYPISSGSAIISRPNEFHHCIYNSDKERHLHFWILFSADGNEGLFPQFFQRAAGTQNLVVWNKELFAKVKKTCYALLEARHDTLEAYALFFQLVRLLEEGKILDADAENGQLPADVLFAIDYIHKNLRGAISVREIAQLANVSVNTLERHFLSTMLVTPSEFLKRRRLALARGLLEQGWTVFDACVESGFSDYSRFIVIFKEYFGVTPLQYKKGRETAN